ncbi:MAG: hypothetical protein GQ570_01255 [Helicobacteraceae bacterium]|nr:hypothetical protein [Helicobacteraceae bacterium]
METSTSYLEHVNIMKELNLHSDFSKVREPYKENFEAIYEEAKAADVKVSNAKDFLNELSAEEMSTLQNYARLVDEVVVNELSDEGAYNLLVHFYEKYDFDNDGITEIGKGKNVSMIPQNMDNDLKEAFVNAINNTDEDDMLAMMVLTLDIDRIKYTMAKHMEAMSESEKAFMREQSSFDIDQFIADQLKNPYHPKPITYESLMDRIDGILNPTGGNYSSPELQESMQKFSETLKNEYQKIKDQNSRDYENSLALSELVKNHDPKAKKQESALETLLQI